MGTNSVPCVFFCIFPSLWTPETWRGATLDVNLLIDKWPNCDWNDNNKKVIIQHDGAPSHAAFERQQYWEQLVESIGVKDKVILVKQPPNSPDTNVLDLGFFRSLQANYYLKNPKNELDIIRFVEQAFEEYPASILNRIWLTHQSCLNEIIRHNGDNNYPTPHMNKSWLERDGMLPLALPVTADTTEWL